MGTFVSWASSALNLTLQGTFALVVSRLLDDGAAPRSLKLGTFVKMMLAQVRARLVGRVVDCAITRNYCCEQHLGERLISYSLFR